MQKYIGVKFNMMCAITHKIFFHPDYTVGFGITPNQLSLVDFTTGGESHPAPKIVILYIYYVIVSILHTRFV